MELNNNNKEATKYKVYDKKDYTITPTVQYWYETLKVLADSYQRTFSATGCRVSNLYNSSEPSNDQATGCRKFANKQEYATGYLKEMFTKTLKSDHKMDQNPMATIYIPKHMKAEI